MAGHDDGEEIGPRRLHVAMRRHHDLILALMRARGEPNGAAGNRRIELAPSGEIGRRRRRVGLEVADIERADRAELREALGEAVVLRQHEIEGREQRPAEIRAPPPALEARRRHAAVDEQEAEYDAPWCRARDLAKSPIRPARRDRDANGAGNAARTRDCRAAHIDARRPWAGASRASRAEVTVAVVSRMRISGLSAAMASITGSAALASPTLAALNQARKP